MEDGLDKLNFITIAVHPADDGFACVVLEIDNPPASHNYMVALTIAHGMVKMALDRPDLIYDEGIDAITHPSETGIINMTDILQNKKRKLN